MTNFPIVNRPLTYGLLYKTLQACARINLSLKTVQVSPPIFGHFFFNKLVFWFFPNYLGLPVLTKYFVKNSFFVS